MQQTPFEPQQSQMGQTGSAQMSGQTSQTGGFQAGQMGGQQANPTGGATQGSQMGGATQGSQTGGGQTQGGQMQASQPQGGTSQGGQMQGGQTQGSDLALRDVETPEQSEAVYEIMRAIQACAWCAEQCVQEANPMMIECIRLCEDVTELGETALALIPRQSRHAQTVVQGFLQAAKACAQECGQHSDSHCQECAQELDNAIYAVEQYASTFGQQGGQRPTSASM